MRFIDKNKKQKNKRKRSKFTKRVDTKWKQVEIYETPVETNSWLTHSKRFGRVYPQRPNAAPNITLQISLVFKSFRPIFPKTNTKVFLSSSLGRGDLRKDQSRERERREERTEREGKTVSFPTSSFSLAVPLPPSLFSAGLPSLLPHPES